MYYSPKTSTDGLVFHYDTGNTVRSYLGEPTTNSFPGYSLYAYASGPVNTPVYNEKNELITAKRYTITNAVNTARAATLPTGLSTGVAYTFSFKWKYNGTTTTSPSIGVSAAKGNPEGGANNNGFASQVGDTVAIGNGWYLTTYTFVFSSCPTGNSILTFGISTGSTSSYVGETFDVYEAQFEVKDHKTPYTPGTRSATQGLKDLRGNSTISLSNVSFDSNAQMTFDGTNDLITLADAAHLKFSNGSFTVEQVLTVNSIASKQRTFSKGSSGWSRGWHAAIRPTQWEFELSDGTSSPGNSFLINTSTTVGTNHVVWAIDSGTTARLYINGVQVGSPQTITEGLAFATTTSTVGIGAFESGGEYFNGKIPYTRVYARTLSADEVQRNFNAVKSRFNIA